MGQTLSEPVTEKHTTSVVRDKQFWVGLSDMQGWRISMEDSHSVHLSLPAGETAATSEDSDGIPTQPAGSTVSNRNKGDKENAFFGVFDGHGGSAVAKFTGTTIHNRLAGLDSYKSGDYAAALKQLFLKTDEDLRADPNFFNEPSGCTATTALITKDNRIFVANAGDSRTVLGYQGKAKALSDDHKPTNKDETARILAAGGFVEFGRVNGNLALSRAIGDFEFKQNYSLDPEKQIVTADPDIAEHKIDGEEEFLVLACDGIWDCLSSQQVVDFTRRAVANGDSLGTIAENMMTKCLARDSETGGIGCDNMTVVIVALLGGRSPEEWQAWVKERVEKKVGYNTPESVPDVFGHIQAPSGLGGLTGAGFRVAGAGSIANIASILGASGLTLRPVTSDDDDHSDTDSNESNELIDDKGVEEGTQPRDVTDDISNLSGEGKRGSVQLVDDDGDSHMDSGDESDTTTAGAPANASASGPSTKDSEKQEQLRSSPKGDEYPAVAKAEGLLDSSESPLKG